MLDAQNGECAICGTPTPASHTDKFSVDHCHTTGKVRGLLCNRCNTSIGGLGDDPNVLLAAATYVARHNQENGVANKPLQSPQRSRAEDYLVKTRPQPVMPRIDPKNITVFNVHQMDLLHQLYIERVSKPIEDEYNRCQREIARLKKDLAVAQRRKLDWKIFQLSCQLEEFEFYAHAPTHWHKVELEFLEEIQSKLDTVKYQLKSLIDDTSSDTLSIVKAISREQAMQLLPALQQLIDTGEHP
jgi:hypothetical protein